MERFIRKAGKTETAKELNAYFDALERKVHYTKRQLIEEDKELTAEAIKNAMLGLDDAKDCKMILEVFAHHNEQLEALIGKDFSKGTLANFTTTYKHTCAFVQHRYKNPDIERGFVQPPGGASPRLKIILAGGLYADRMDYTRFGGVQGKDAGRY